MKKVFLSLFLCLIAILLVACSKNELTPVQKELKFLEHTTQSNVQVPLRESKILINSTDAPYQMQQLASYSTNPTFFKVTEYSNGGSGYYLYYTGETVANSYLQANRVIFGGLNCTNRTGARTDNVALLECKLPDADIKVSITKLNELETGVEVNWMMKNE